METSKHSTNKAYAAGVVLTVLGACSSGSAVETTSRAAESAIGIIPETLELEYDEVADVVTITHGVASRTIARLSDLDTPGFFAYGNRSDGFTYVTFGETSSGSGLAAAGASSTSAAISFAGSVFERVGDTDMPTSGSSNYTGAYTGLFASDPDLVGILLIAGDASIDADFSTALINGSITNRRDLTGPVTFADIQLEAASIVDGAFTGTTSGGAADEEGSTVSPGEYGGLFTGATGQEVVGGVQLSHDIDGTRFIESGAFIAE